MGGVGWGMVAGAVLGVVAGLVLLRRRGARRAAEAAQAAAATAYEQALVSYRAAVTAWERRRDELGAVLAAATGEYAGDQPPLDLHRGEQPYGVVAATLVERYAGRVRELEEGRLVVTDRRVVFTGSRTVEWPLGVVQSRRVGEHTTLFRSPTSEGWAGVSYPESRATRLLLEFAGAVSHDARVSMLRALAQRLTENDLRRPELPEPPAPAPGLGRRARAAAAAWQAARLAELHRLRDSQPVPFPVQRIAPAALPVPAAG